MSQRTESFFFAPQNTRLFYQSWEAASPKGHLVITHGQGEHSSSYERVVEALKDLDISVYAWDLRGHGRSEGQRGYARQFEDYVRDFETFLQHLKSEKNLYPEHLILLGHSMGGLIQLMTLLANPHWSFRGQVLSSPMLGVAVQVPMIKDVAALIFSNLLPQLTLDNEIRTTDLTRDPEILKEFEMDVLRHHRISSGVYLGAVTAIEILRQKIQQITAPTLWQIPEVDPVVGSENSKAMFRRLGSTQKILCQYPDRKHEIYNDLGREQVFEDLRNFIRDLK
jgi:lysophospholipase